MISHRNVIANTLQLATFDSPQRKEIEEKDGDSKQVVLGLLPYSHIYGLVAVVHASIYQGDKLICLPKFEMKTYFESIQRFGIQMLFVV
jgi:acyl-CoA synthetase (AMP-forming)/AMP-acid ligase II